jgi:hypothetical protein
VLVDHLFEAHRDETMVSGVFKDADHGMVELLLKGGL